MQTSWLSTSKKVPEEYAVYRYALQYPFNIGRVTSNYLSGKYTISQERARYKDRIYLNIEYGNLLSIKCHYNGSTIPVYGNQQEGFFFDMPMGDVNLEIEFDNSVIIQANDGGDGYYWATYYPTMHYLCIADENTTVYQAAVKGGYVELTEVPGRRITMYPWGGKGVHDAVILRSSKPVILLTPIDVEREDYTPELHEGNELLGWNESAPYESDVYVLSRGDDGKGPLGFYKYDRSVMGTPTGAHLELPKGSQPPAAVTINK